MNTRILMTIALLVFVTNTAVYAQWRSKTHDVYNTLDGDKEAGQGGQSVR